MVSIVESQLLDAAFECQDVTLVVIGLLHDAQRINWVVVFKNDSGNALCGIHCNVAILTCLKRDTVVGVGGVLLRVRLVERTRAVDLLGTAVHQTQVTTSAPALALAETVDVVPMILEAGVSLVAVRKFLEPA